MTLVFGVGFYRLGDLRRVGFGCGFGCLVVLVVFVGFLGWVFGGVCWCLWWFLDLWGGFAVVLVAVGLSCLR